MVNSNIEPNSPPLRDIRLWNPMTLTFDLSRLLRIKSDGVPIFMYAFLLMVNSNVGPNSAALRDMTLWILSDLDYYLSRSLKVKSDSEVGLLIFDFLSVSNSNYISISYPLAVIAVQKFFSFVSPLDQNSDPPHTPLPRLADRQTDRRPALFPCTGSWWRHP